MLKRFAYKKFIIISFSFIILLIVYLFPTNEKYNIYTTLTYSDMKTMPIYLIDNNDLVSRFEVIKKKEETLDLIDEIINNLTVDNNNHYIPNNFKKIIPKNTKILNKDLKDGLLKIDFSKEILNIEKNLEEKLIESLIYSLTEIKEINKIMIFVDGKHLNELPYSKKVLPNTLDRSYGINKVYEVESMKDISKITTYYVSKTDNILYYTPITTVSNTKEEKVKVIIEHLKTSPSYQTNLISYLKTSAELLNYEILENSINLSFNNEILSLDDDKITEEVKYSIALSLKDTYNINETIFFINDMLIDVMFI